MNPIRKVLLADPVMVAHSLLYYEAALASTGFENTCFTIATATRRKDYRQKAIDFVSGRQNTQLRLLEVDSGTGIGRLETWRGFVKSMAAVEKLLQSEPFDLIAYASMDPLLLYFASPGFGRRFPVHFRTGVSGTLFRDNGLRPPVAGSVKGNLLQQIDLWILRRALTNPGLRKVAFLDRWCADRAGEKFHSAKCGYGLDPVFFAPYDQNAARRSFNLRDGDFAVLLFGVLSNRKGILETLRMLRAAPLSKEKTVIIVAGPARSEIRLQLETELAGTARQYRVIREDRFLSQAETPRYFAAADCVICIYNRFSGSSSVLLHAAAYGKPVIVSPGGAMEDAVTRHRFGEIVRIDDSAAFATAITKITGLTPSERERLTSCARDYAQTMDARQYMSQFLTCDQST